MLSVSKDWRKRGIGNITWCTMCCYFVELTLIIASTLVRKALDVMKQDGVEEVFTSHTDISPKFLTSFFAGSSRDRV
jgi:hypothetical protein